MRISLSRVGKVRGTTIHAPLGVFARCCADVRLHGRKGIERRQGRPELAQPGFERMNVRIHQARQHGPAMQVDDFGSGTALGFENGVVRADRRDLPRFDRNGLLNCEASVYRDDLTVIQNQIGIGCR